MKKLKVVWICHFSNAFVRSRLELKKHPLNRVLRGDFHDFEYIDYAIWNTNAIREFERFEDIDLHVISMHDGMKKTLQKFESNGVHYYFYRTQDDDMSLKLRRKLFKQYGDYRKNRKIVADLVDQIQPDIVHLIGAENPNYSLSVLDLPKKYPVLTILLTFMSSPNFLSNYPISKELYAYRSNIERQVLKRSDYVCTILQYAKDYIHQNIDPQKKVLPLRLAGGLSVDRSSHDKEFDLVYFSRYINKAVDLVIEAMGLVCKTHPGVRLNVIGEYDAPLKEQLDKRIAELGMTDNIVFSGSFPEYEDVLKQVVKSRIALLPLKVDFIASTLRESMSLGLPVVTTITRGTPSINKDRETVLLSETGDHEALAANIMKVLDSEELFTRLRENGFKYIEENVSNTKNMEEWRQAYYDILNERSK